MLGMLGIGAAAGPAIAENIVSQSSEKSVLAHNYKYDVDYGLVNKYAPDVVQENPLQRLEHIREHYNFLKDKGKWVNDVVSREVQELHRYGSYQNHIDPDIMALKSFSMSAKIRFHVQRRAERRYDQEFSEVSEQLKYWMEKVGL
jgi:hypothetical protein